MLFCVVHGCLEGSKYIMRKKSFRILFAGLCFALLVPLSAFADVVINEQNFPDYYFRNFLLAQSYGYDGVITDEEIAGITNLRLDALAATKYARNITNLEGIKFFTALTSLDCSPCPLTSLDVSGMTALTTLKCRGSYSSLYNCELTELNVTGCTSLTILDCSSSNYYGYGNGKLTTLYLSGCTALTGLSCSSNQLTSLAVSKNTALTFLDCSYNQLTSLNASGCTALKTLYCDNNQLTSLDVSGCTALTRLYCYNNKISGVNLDAFISSLSNTEGRIYIYDSTSEIEGNVCTKAQVAAIKAKWWTPYYYNGREWLRYEGSDAPDGIIATEAANGSEFDTNAPAYDLNGRRVENWQSTSGIYIINDKKVVVK